MWRAESFLAPLSARRESILGLHSDTQYSWFLNSSESHLIRLQVERPSISRESKRIKAGYAVAPLSLRQTTRRHSNAAGRSVVSHMYGGTCSHFWADVQAETTTQKWAHYFSVSASQLQPSRAVGPDSLVIEPARDACKSAPLRTPTSVYGEVRCSLFQF